MRVSILSLSLSLRREGGRICYSEPADAQEALCWRTFAQRRKFVQSNFLSAGAE